MQLPDQLENLLSEFLAVPAETEWLEFKTAARSFPFDDLGKYFSALSNEANLGNRDVGWLVFGVSDQPPREIKGTAYRPARKALDSLKQEIAKETGGITFREIHELVRDGRRVVLFEIPAAPKGIPVSWKGHYYGRNGESLSALSMMEMETIRAQVAVEDWTAHLLPGATLDCLDPEALRKARISYKDKHEKAAFRDEIDAWDDLTFLNKARLAVQGQLTRAAIILLGRPESVSFLQPAVAQISWVLKDADGIEMDYQHFHPPLFLNVDHVFAKIRNLTLRELPGGTLFPVEISQYDEWVMREALHNCIAHQDYRLQSRISLVETPEELLFSNAGRFLPGSVDTVLHQDAPPSNYPNRLLTEAMVNLNMIDTIGSGIKRMFVLQKKRFMPMPDYDLSIDNQVRVRIPGRILDENYTRLLIRRQDLRLDETVLLDKIQKRMPIAPEAAKALRKHKLIEGRFPNLYVSAGIAKATGQAVEYTKNRAFDKQYYKDLILQFLKQHGEATPEDIQRLIMDKLSDVLDEEQRKNKVRSLVYEMSRKDGLIRNVGDRGANARWKLSE